MLRDEWVDIPRVGKILTRVESLGYAVTVVVADGQTRVSAVRQGQLVVARRDGDDPEALRLAVNEIANECVERPPRDSRGSGK
jgi:hypothetical protein